MTEQEIAAQLRELQGFRAGMLVSLVSLKAAIQLSPDFNRTVLEDCLTYFLALPPSTGDVDAYRCAINVLRNDNSTLLKELRYVP